MADEKGSLESRVLYLEQVLNAQTKLNSMLFPMIFHHDADLRGKVAEVLRQMLVSQAVKASPVLELQMRNLRAVLVEPIPQEIAEAAGKPPLRPVD